MPPLTDPTLFYVAAFGFLLAVLLEFWRRTHEIHKYARENPLSDRMEKAVHYFRENKGQEKITNDVYQKLTGVSDATATRDLDKLEELGFLEQRGRTRGAYYRPTFKAREHLKTHTK